MHRIPYEIPPQGGLQATGGQPSAFPIPFPSRAVISKIIIVQTSGTAVDFTAALYNRLNASEGQPESESLSGDVVVPLPPDLYRVTPDLDGTDGELKYFADYNGGYGFVFYSQDTLAQQQTARLGNPRMIYLVITPSGSGAVEYAVAIAGEVYG